jgi:glycosyltransferase 2 family protein
MRKVAAKSLGWIISLGFLGLVLLNVDWSEFLIQFKKVAFVEIVILTAIYLLGFLVRAVRCAVLLPGLGWKQSFKAVVLGYAANNVLPARLGELVRAQVTAKSSGIKRSTALASILVERILDGCAIVCLLLIGSGGLDLPPMVDKVRLTGVLLFSAAMIGVFVIGYTESFWRGFLPEGRLGEILHGLGDGVSLATRDVLSVIFVLVLSALIWIVEGVMFYYAARVFNLPVTLQESYFVLGLVNLGVLIPSSPGNVGVFQYFAVLALGVLDISSAQATAYSIVIHMCQWAPVTLLGFLFLSHFGFRSFADLRGKSKGASSETESSEPPIAPSLT